MIKYIICFVSILFFFPVVNVLAQAKKTIPSSQKLLQLKKVKTPVGKEWKRKVLGIFYGDLEDPNDPSNLENHLQLKFQMVLNHYGYYAKLLNIRAELLPNDHEMKQYDYIVTWFNTPYITNPSIYLNWLEKQIQKGKKLIILGHTGLEEDGNTSEKLNLFFKKRILSLIDLVYEGKSKPHNTHVKISSIDSKMMGFEFKLKNPP
ncbi:MAG: hypothetical protein ACI86H_002097, partial [bacterium]